MNKTLLSTIIAILIAGGAIGGYKVIRDNKADVFENSIHPVVNVIDGDTIKIPSYTDYIKTEDGYNNEDGIIRVRLLGINSPEKGECYYKESKDFLKKLIEDKEINIRKDISGVDDYDRLLRYVFLPADSPEDDEIFVNQVLVEEGYAFSEYISPDKMYRELLVQAQEKAKRNNKGIWNSCDISEMSSQKDKPVFAEPENSECTIKGNISETGEGKIYFVKGCAGYPQTKIDLKKGEQYFCTEKEAEDAGFRRAKVCPEE